MKKSCSTERSSIFDRPSFIVYLLLVFATVQIPHIFEPPDHVHTFRQALTAGVAKSYSEDGATFLRPRVLERQNTSGVIGMEFPLYQYIVYLTFEAIGFNHGSGKAISLMAALVALYAFFLFMRRIFSLRLSNIISLALVSSPLYYMYAAKVMPEMMAFMFHVLALLFFTMAFYNSSATARPKIAYVYLFPSLLFLQLATLIKMNTIIAAFFMAYIVYRRFGWDFLKLPYLYAYALLGVIPFYYWYNIYVPLLDSETGLDVFFLGYPLKTTLPMLINGGINYPKMFFDVLPEGFVGWGQVIIFVFALYWIVRTKEAYRTPGWVYAAGTVSIIYFMLLIVKSGDKFINGHSYYMFGALPYVPIVMGYMIDKTAQYTRFSYRSYSVGVLVFLALTLAGRVSHTYLHDPVPERLIKIGTIVDTIVPKGELIAVNSIANPMYLYYYNRKGWLLKDQIITNKQKIDKFVDDGLLYLVIHPIGSFDEKWLKMNLTPKQIWSYPDEDLNIVLLR